MRNEQRVVDELTGVAHTAADALTHLMQNGGPPHVLIEPALNSVSDPVRAAVVMREWLRRCWTPELEGSQMSETFRTMEIRPADMTAHLGPSWVEIVDDLFALIGSDYPRWVDSLDSDIDLDAVRGQVFARAATIKKTAHVAGLEAEWENAVMLPQIISQHNGGLYLSANRGHENPQLALDRNEQALLLMVSTVAGAFEARPAR